MESEINVCFPFPFPGPSKGFWERETGNSWDGELPCSVPMPMTERYKFPSALVGSLILFPFGFLYRMEYRLFFTAKNAYKSRPTDINRHLLRVDNGLSRSVIRRRREARQGTDESQQLYQLQRFLLGLEGLQEGQWKPTLV